MGHVERQGVFTHVLSREEVIQYRMGEAISPGVAQPHPDPTQTTTCHSESPSARDPSLLFVPPALPLVFLSLPEA